MSVCFICGRAPLDGALCFKHAQLANLWSAVRGGVLSDWSLDCPNHTAMMTLGSPYGMKSNWQVDLAVILATHGIMLDDGAGYGE